MGSVGGSDGLMVEDDPFYFAVKVEGDQVLLARPSATVADRPAVVAAACRNYKDWLNDRALTPDVVLAEDDSLIRSAELLDGVFAGEEVAFRAEEHRIRDLGRDSIVAELRAAGFSDAQVEGAELYLDMVGDPPSEDARRRYGAYLTSNTTTVRLVVLTDVSQPVTVEPPRSRILSIKVALPDGTIVGVPQESCWR